MINDYKSTFNNKPVKSFEIGDSIDLQFCYRIESIYEAKDSVIDKLTYLITQDSSKQLEELVIGAWQESYDVDCSDILNFLIENKASFASIKHVFVGDMTYEDCEISWIQQADYTAFFKAYVDLETFHVRGGVGLVLGKFELPNLKSLVIETGGLNHQVITDLTASKTTLKNLEHLQLWLGEENYGATVEPELFVELLAQELPNLKYLGLQNSEIQDDIVVMLTGHPILNQLEVLDVSMGTLTDVGATSLLNNESLLKLKHINCRHHFISDALVAQLRTKFAEQNINLDDQEELKNDWLYVEVGE